MRVEPARLRADRIASFARPLSSHHTTSIDLQAMILLDSANELILEVLQSKFTTPGPLDQTFTDFDDVSYYLESPKAGPLTLSMEIRCWGELESAGATEVLKREYGQWLQSQPKDGYSVTLSFDYEALPKDTGQWSN